MLFVGYILTAIAGYLLGSIPTGFIVGKMRGLDIRTVGSGNIGATNVFRALGTPAGIVVLLCDALKGWLAVAVVAVLLAQHFGRTESAQAHEWFRLVGGLAAILGHNYTCWLHFKGGKGIATSAGVLAALVPYALLTVLGLWIIAVAVTRYVSVGSVLAAAALPFATWFLPPKHDSTLTAVTAVVGALAIYKHKANIRRLLNGTENRLSAKKAPKEEGKPVS